MYRSQQLKATQPGWNLFFKPVTGSEFIFRSRRHPPPSVCSGNDQGHSPDHYSGRGFQASTAIISGPVQMKKKAAGRSKKNTLQLASKIIKNVLQLPLATYTL
jgi:hypothetical protein